MALKNLGSQTAILAEKYPPLIAPSKHGDTNQHLARMEACLSSSGLPFINEIRRIGELSGRLAEGRFHLAVLGQFKRGKSTLLNALLGTPLLPTSVVPLTAIPTFIRYGSEPLIRVTIESKTEANEFHCNTVEEQTTVLERFVTEEKNPNNRLNVNEVEVRMPSPLLAKGVVLIDTPGIGSTYRHNTEATLNFLPQCDAALFLVSVDPPITDVEISFLREVLERVPKLFFVLNKIDYLDEKERTTALEFLKRTLAANLDNRDTGHVFVTSARLALQAKTAGDDQMWLQSGLADLERHLVDFLAFEKNTALEQAVCRKAADIAETALMRFQLTIRSLEMPQEELEQRLVAFDKALTAIQQEQIVVQDLLAGDKRRTLEFLEEQSERLRNESRTFLTNVLHQSSAFTAPGHINEKEAQEALADAIPAFFEKNLGALAKQMNEHVVQILVPHQRLVDDLVEKIRHTAAELFEIPYRPLDGARSFEFKEQPYWVTHKWDSTMNPLPENWFDRLLPQRFSRARSIKRLSRKIELLVMHNVENVRWAAIKNINRAFARFSSDLEKYLEETVAATKGAIHAACAKRDEQEESIAMETVKFRCRIEELEHLLSDLKRQPLDL